MSIKYGDDYNFLKFYGKHTIKQALIEKNLFDHANIDEYFAMFLQGYIDEYDDESAKFGTEDIQNVLADTKKKIEHYDNYNIEYALAQLFEAPLPPPYEIYRIHKEIVKKSNENTISTNQSNTTLIESINKIVENTRILSELLFKDNDAKKSEYTILIDQIKALDDDNDDMYKKNHQKYKENIVKIITTLKKDIQTYDKTNIDAFINFHKELKKMKIQWKDIKYQVGIQKYDWVYQYIYIIENEKKGNVHYYNTGTGGEHNLIKKSSDGNMQIQYLAKNNKEKQEYMVKKKVEKTSDLWGWNLWLIDNKKIENFLEICSIFTDLVGIKTCSDVTPKSPGRSPIFALLSLFFVF